MITIDGTYGEGGGQIIRTAVTLSAITQTPIEIVGIRGRRPKPGLQAQHLAAVRAMAQVCGADLSGDAIGSVYLAFRPSCEPRPGSYAFEIGTAGSCNLVLQTVMLALARASGPSHVTVTGGTHNAMAPTSHYLQQVALPAMRAMGLEAQLAVGPYGFYPKGGGQVTLDLAGQSRLQGVDWSSRSGALRAVATVLTVDLPDHVASRGAATVRKVLSDQVRVLFEAARRLGPGAAVQVATTDGGCFAGFTGLGEKGKPMEKVAEEAVQGFLAWQSGEATVDEHLADQLILPASLAEGPTQYRTSEVTDHLRTMAWLVPQFLPARIDIDESGWVRVCP